MQNNVHKRTKKARKLKQNAANSKLLLFYLQRFVIKWFSYCLLNLTFEIIQNLKHIQCTGIG